MNEQNLAEIVKDKYRQAALRVATGGSPRCGGSDCRDPITSDLYDASEAAQIPQDAVTASLGCGNPTALAHIIHES